MWISNPTKIINDSLWSNFRALKTYTLFLSVSFLELVMNYIDWVWFVIAAAKMEILLFKVDDLADSKVKFNYFRNLHQLQKSANIRLWSRLSGINSRRTCQETDPVNYESCWCCRGGYYISPILCKLCLQMGSLIRAINWINF